MFDQMCGENLDFALEKWLKFSKVLEYKVGQLGLLIHADFAILKALETHADIMQIRFRINLNLNTTPFYLKLMLNLSKVDTMQKILPKHEITSKEKIKEERFQNIHTNDLKQDRTHKRELLRL